MMTATHRGATMSTDDTAQGPFPPPPPPERSARAPVTRIPQLDDVLGGALQPGVHVVHASPGAGKTALALQIAATCGFPALFVTCEMAPLELLRRITARVTETLLGRLKSGEYDPTRVVKLA